MSKSKHSGGTSTPSKKKSGMLAHLAKVAANNAAKIKGKVGAIIAMLYIRGDNGRMSGRASGNVYMRNGRIRQFVVPALVQNGYTTAARALLSQWSSAWEALTDEQRDSWLNITWLFKSDRFGVPVQIKGKAAYVALNTNLTLVGSSTLTYAPADSGGVPQITDVPPFAIDQSSTTMNMAYTPTPTDAGVDHLIFATKILPAGVSRPRSSDFRLIGTLAGGTASPDDLNTPYSAKFGSSWALDPAQIGKKVFIKLRAVNIETGATGADIVSYGTIQA